MIDHVFSYRFHFEWQNLNVTCIIQKDFHEITPIEDLSKISHEYRRKFAIYLLQKYAEADMLYASQADGQSKVSTRHSLSLDDFNGPFGSEILNHLSGPFETCIVKRDGDLSLTVAGHFLFKYDLKGMLSRKSY